MSLPAIQKFCQSPFAHGEISRRACAGMRDGKIVSAINAAGRCVNEAFDPEI
jgi:hypothetical protein